MIRLTNALNAWGTSDFEDVLRAEVRQLSASQLPLQQALTTGSYAVDSKLDVMIIRVAEGQKFIRAKAGIFYTGIIAGCSCADDPTPVDEQSEYCEVLIEIDRTTGDTRIMPTGD